MAKTRLTVTQAVRLYKHYYHVWQTQSERADNMYGISQHTLAMIAFNKATDALHKVNALYHTFRRAGKCLLIDSYDDLFDMCVLDELADMTFKTPLDAGIQI